MRMFVSCLGPKDSARTISGDLPGVDNGFALVVLGAKGRSELVSKLCDDRWKPGRKSIMFDSVTHVQRNVALELHA